MGYQEDLKAAAAIRGNAIEIASLRQERTTLKARVKVLEEKLATKYWEGIANDNKKLEERIGKERERREKAEENFESVDGQCLGLVKQRDAARKLAQDRLQEYLEMKAELAALSADFVRQQREQGDEIVRLREEALAGAEVLDHFCRNETGIKESHHSFLRGFAKSLRRLSGAPKGAPVENRWKTVACEIAREMRIRKGIADKRQGGWLMASWLPILASDLEAGEIKRPRILDDGTVRQ